MFNSFLSLQNLFSSSGLVKISASIWSFEHFVFFFLLFQVQESTIAMWQWECRKAHKQPSSTFKNKAYRCSPSFHKRSPTKRRHLHRECGHRRSTCRHIHQATWWEEVLQAKEWIEHTWLLQYVLISASSHSYHILGSFMKIKWIWCLYGTTIACMFEMI